MGLKPVLAKTPLTKTYLTQRWKAIRALKAWLKGLEADGAKASLETYALQHKIRPSVLKRVLAKDAKVQEEVFAPLAVESKLGLTKVMAKIHSQLEHEELGPAMTVRIGEFLAKYSGGAYTKREDAGLQTNIQINLPPNLYDHPDKVEIIANAKQEFKDV